MPKNRRRPRSILLVPLAGIMLSLVPFARGGEGKAPDAEQLKFFEARIRPVLIEHCYRCHGDDPAKIKGDLRVDSRAGLLKGGSSGHATLVPGDVENSLLIKAIRHADEDVQMPPKKRLPASVIADFEQWVSMGAPDPRTDVGSPARVNAPAAADSTEAKRFWSFVPPADAPVPAVNNAAWARTDIDRFILAKLEEKGLAPAPAADRWTLIRRATFDLAGLPPTPAEVDAFLADDTAEAFAKVVDRLLASPAYGERWGRHWLDVVRYADTAGDSSDYPIPQAYKYRNYVIDAFNADKPYDQFVREQIAGDLMPARDPAERNERTIATGFLAIARRFGVQPQSQMHLTIDDAIDTTTRGLLGLTVSCARCHDHKFDPIPTRDYYALYGIFASTRFPFAGSEEMKYQKDVVPLLSGDGGQVETAFAVADAAHVADARVMRRGEPHDLGDVAPRGFLTVLGGQRLAANAKASGRLELAGWIADPANPLTARVMVNRIWQHHFGRGIVASSGDFGSRGTPPTNPALLDHLAVRFVRSGWSIKALHRQIMLSSVYQLSGATDARNAAIDADNAFHWRFDRRRLDAEAMRDSMLALSGALDRTMPAAHPFPPASTWGWSQHNAFSAVYESKHRSVYVMNQRIQRHPYFGTFDGADPNVTTAARAVSTTPLQALYLMNAEFVHRQAEGFAATLAPLPTDAARITAAYREALARGPTAQELADAQD